MHEFSIAQALLARIEQHAPAGRTVLSVRVRIGPVKAIDPEALLWAWRAATEGTRFDGTRLDFELPPWRMLCPVCGRDWRGDNWFEPCACGCMDVRVEGGDELLLLSITVDDEQAVKSKEPRGERGERRS